MSCLCLLLRLGCSLSSSRSSSDSDRFEVDAGAAARAMASAPIIAVEGIFMPYSSGGPGMNSSSVRAADAFLQRRQSPGVDDDVVLEVDDALDILRGLHPEQRAEAATASP